jgi:DNA-binding FrmR family transcriptional regulator
MGICLFVENHMAKQNGRARTAGGAGRTERKAVAVAPEIKAANLVRLKRIEGQVRGIHKMVEEDRYCADVLGQLSAIQQALRAVGRELIRNHLRHCATDAIHRGGAPADTMYDELVDLFHKNAR